MFRKQTLHAIGQMFDTCKRKQNVQCRQTEFHVEYRHGLQYDILYIFNVLSPAGVNVINAEDAKSKT